MLIRVLAELSAISVCFLIFQSVHVMEQTERSDALIRRHNWWCKFIYAHERKMFNFYTF